MILDAEDDLEVVGEASDGLPAVEQAKRLAPDVVLMDIRMPELDGIEATRRVLAAGDDTKVLMLTTFDLNEYVYDALRAGASGFLLKDVPPEQLADGIRVVAGGDALLAPSITRRLIQEFAVPDLRCSMDTWTGAALTRLVVKVAAEVQGFSEMSSATSSRATFGSFIPHGMLPQKKPAGAQTPPRIFSIIEVLRLRGSRPSN